MILWLCFYFSGYVYAHSFRTWKAKIYTIILSETGYEIINKSPVLVGLIGLQSSKEFLKYLNILFINLLLLYKYRKDLIRLFRRFFRNTLFKLSNLTINLKVELTNTFDGKSDKLLYIEAFAVLFSRINTYFIPPEKLNYYCKLLGIKVNNHYFVTNSAFAKAKNISSIKYHIISMLSVCFKSDIDSIVWLDYYNNVGVGGYGEIIKSSNYVIVTNDSTFQCNNNNKYIYTLGQGGCRVVIVQFEEDGFLLSHYRKKCFSKLLFDICEAIIRRYHKKLKCFVISYDPIEDSILLKQALNPFCNNIEIYCHEKKEISYNIKFSAEADLKIYYAESLVKKVRNPRFLQLYRTSTSMFYTTTKYKEMSFFKFEK